MTSNQGLLQKEVENSEACQPLAAHSETGAGCGSGDGLVPSRAFLLFVLSPGVQQC